MGKTESSRTKAKSVSFCIKSRDGSSLSPPFMNVETDITAARVHRKEEASVTLGCEPIGNMAQKDQDDAESSASLSGSREMAK